jgi:hypothetical protein
MTPLDVKFIGSDELAWPDLAFDRIEIADSVRLAVVSDATVWEPGVLIRLDHRDGKALIVQTTARLFMTAARMIEARFPDLMQEPD